MSDIYNIATQFDNYIIYQINPTSSMAPEKPSSKGYQIYEFDVIKKLTRLTDLFVSLSSLSILPMAIAQIIYEECRFRDVNKLFDTIGSIISCVPNATIYLTDILSGFECIPFMYAKTVDDLMCRLLHELKIVCYSGMEKTY